MISQEDIQQNSKHIQYETIHTKEVIIGTEQGTTFPTKIGTSMCNALIDTGATKSCISERYFQQLPSMKMLKLGKINVRSAMGSNLTPLGMIQCSFELGKKNSMATSLFVEILPDPSYWEEIFFYSII